MGLDDAHRENMLKAQEGQSSRLERIEDQLYHLFRKLDSIDERLQAVEKRTPKEE